MTLLRFAFGGVASVGLTPNIVLGEPVDLWIKQIACGVEIAQRCKLMSRRVSTLYVSVFVGLALTLSPSPSSAAGIALSDVTVDWTGFGILLTGDLTIESPAHANKGACASAFTNGGGLGHCRNSVQDPLTWSYQSASFGYSTSDGYASAQASTANGLLASESGAGVMGSQEALFTARSDAATTFWSYVYGIGTITVTIPYTLTVACQADEESTSAIAEVYAASIAAVLPLRGGGYDSLTCLNNGTSNKSGVLTISGNVVSSGKTFGVEIQAHTNAKAQVHVSEPATAVLLAAGLAALRWRRNS